MNILFCHDGPINFARNRGYYSIGFNDKLFSRYKSVFGNVSFVTRVNYVEESEKYAESDKLSLARVIEYPNYLTLRGVFADKSESNRMLEKEVSLCDALIVRLPSFLGSRCVRLAEKYGKPYLVELVGCPWDSLKNHGASGKLLAPYMRNITRRQVGKAPFVLYVTDKFLQKRYPTHGRQIGCSDVELWNLKNEIRKKLYGDKLILGTAGKIDIKYKGHKTVIEAMKILVASGYDVYYSVAGPGDKTYLYDLAKKNGVESRITFIGSLSHSEIFSWLDTLDVYIQPSLTEGMPRALIEAMSRGCPCVASDAGGMPELLDSAFVFKKGNAQKLADIFVCAKDNGLFESGDRNARIAMRFAPESLKKKREAFYNEFLRYVMRQKDERG